MEYTYPFTLPPSINGPGPDLELTYDSGSVDGMTQGTNNQASWVGLGWDLPIGSIERRYKACADDGTTDSRAADLCWAGNNAVLSLNGQSGELIRDPSDASVWRLANDPGWKIDKISGASNGDDDGEYWRVTDQKGWRYYFGVGTDVRGTATNSVETVPVSGNNATEPCYNATPSASFCNQAWRWNLDRIIDPNGTQMAVHWVQETNKYGEMGSSSNAVPYVRNAYPDSIEYAMDNSSTSVHRRQVLFTTAYRCAALDGTCPSPVTANDDDYPDTPLDLQCDSAPCTEHSPSFFSTRRLTTVTAQAYDSGAWKTVDRWDLTQAFVDPDTSTTADDQEQALWLSSIQRTGAYSPSDGFGSTITLPSSFFYYQRYANRVDYNYSLGVLPMTLPRLDEVRTELDGVTDITYGQPDACSKTALPTPATNTQDCFPEYSAPEGGTAGFGWYNKWLVSSAVDHDEASGDPDRPHTYTYTGGGAWHHDDNNFAPANQRSWSIWRGYGQVKEVDGAPSSSDSQTTITRYFRGMHDDQTASGGQKTVSVSTTVGTVASFTDYNDLAGRVLQVEHTTLGGTDLSASVTLYWRHITVDAAGDERFDAYYTRPSEVDSYDYGAGGGSARHTREINDYDPTYGYVVDVQHLGDVATSSDDTCTTYTRFPDSTTWFDDYVQSEQLLNTTCAGTLVSQTNTHYDGQAYGVTPTHGNPTVSIRSVSATVSETTTSTFDTYGRVTSVDAPARAEVDTDYHGAAYPGLVTTTTVGTPQIKSESTMDPIRGVVVSATSNSAQVGGVTPTTSLGYDQLGRLTGVWLPGRTQPATANTIYLYQIGDTAQPMVTTRQLQSGGTYVESYALSDSYGEARETQVHAHTGNRTVTATTYDDVGRVAVQQGPVFASGSPGVNILNPTLASTGSYVTHVYDAAGRVTADQTGGAGVTHYSTTTSYGVGSKTVTPADQAATTTNYNGLGQVSDVTSVNESSGGIDGTIDYTYDPRGELTGIDQSDVATGATHLTTTYSYDWLGRRVSALDPDAGETHTAYTDNADDSTVTSKVIRHADQAILATSVTSYDGAGRQTEVDSVSGGVSTPEAKWNYPTSLLTSALLASTDSADSGGTLRNTSYGYDVRGEVTSVTLPTPGVSTTDPAATNAYPLSMTYDEAGHPSTVTLPAVGAAAKETLTTGYDTLGFLNSLTSSLTSPTSSYLASSTYDTLGRLTGRNLGSASTGTSRVARTFGWDPVTGGLSDSLTTVTTRSGSTDTMITPSHLILAYNDADLHAVDETSPHNSGMAERQCLTYDSRGRLAQAWTRVEGGACSDVTNFKYGAAPYKSTFTFDALGRLTEARDLKGVVPAGGGTITTQTIDQVFGYHPDGVTKPAHGPDSVTGGAAGTLTVGYAADGSGKAATLTQGASPVVSRTLGYDWAQRLSSVTRSGTGGSTPGAPGTTASLSYNADGSLWRRVDASGTTFYLGADQIRLPTGGGTPLITRTYSAGGTAIAVRSTTATTSTTGAWITGDTQGSPALEVDWISGAVTWRMQDPYGAPRNGQAVPGTPAAGAGTTRTFGDATLAGYSTLPGQDGFLGKTEDPTSDLDLLGARSYDPGLGLFLQPDPLSQPGDTESLSGYLYSDADPIGYLDPTGLMLEGEGGGSEQLGNSCHGFCRFRHLAGDVGNGLNSAMQTTTGVTVAVTAGAINAAQDIGDTTKYGQPLDGFGFGPDITGDINDKLKDEVFSITGFQAAEDRHQTSEKVGYAATTVASMAAGGEESVAASLWSRITGRTAEDATGVIKGTNTNGLVNSRGSFRKTTLQDAWDGAKVGPTGGRLCPTCGAEVSVPPNTGVPRDWDGSHFPSWSNRVFPSTIERSEILDNYNEGVSLECPVCNRGAGNDDARFGP